MRDDAPKTNERIRGWFPDGNSAEAAVFNPRGVDIGIAIDLEQKPCPQLGDDIDEVAPATKSTGMTRR